MSHPRSQPCGVADQDPLLALWERDMLAGYEVGSVNERLLAALLRDVAA